MKYKDDVVIIVVDGVIMPNVIGVGKRLQISRELLSGDDYPPPYKGVIKHVNHFPVRKILLSERNESERESLKTWLRKHDVHHAQLWLRGETCVMEKELFKASAWDAISKKYGVWYFVDEDFGVACYVGIRACRIKVLETQKEWETFLKYFSKEMDEEMEYRMEKEQRMEDSHWHENYWESEWETDM